ncbi:MAG: hypothetical protein BWX60_00451 [Candidatus Marinimicrobia bacterium ADurb.Bin030]|nr:MAG: hypothetical protein BWX60_00451 [Candidatus Marinimicrobia bacterium ADurb.Bin030]
MNEIERSLAANWNTIKIIRGNLRTARNFTEIGFDFLHNLVRIEVTGENKRGIVGGIVGTIVFIGVITINTANIFHPTDNRIAVRVIFVDESINLLSTQSNRAILGALFAFFHYNLELRFEFLRVKSTFIHPFGLDVEG